MGIRIHKMLGYGLTDVRYEKYSMSDPRINLLDWESEQAEKTVADLLPFMEQRDADYFLLGAMVNTDKSIKPDMKLRDRCVVWNSEYGMGNVLCLIPPSCLRSWYRYDNILDYAEETYVPGREQHNYVKVLDSAIYPFIEYWDTRTGERVDTSTYCMCRRMSGQKGADEIVRHLFKVSDYAEFLTVFAPKPPSELLAMCEFLQLLNTETAWQLRPMIYVYWG